MGEIICDFMIDHGSHILVAGQETTSNTDDRARWICMLINLLWPVSTLSRRTLLINLETSVEGHSVSPGGERGLVTGICFANRKTESTKVWNTSINSHSCTWRQVWCNEIQQNHLGWKIVFILPLNFRRNMMQN